MIERRSEIVKNPEIITSQQQEFVDNVIDVLLKEQNHLAKNSPRYKNLKENIKQLRHFQDYDFEIVEITNSQETEIHGINILGPKKVNP